MRQVYHVQGSFRESQVKQGSVTNPSIQCIHKHRAIRCTRKFVFCRAEENGSGILSVDKQYMEQALELAKRGLGKTEPNPAVGCVIVKDGQVVGEGFHPKAGEPHAEVFALRAAGQKAEGATAYVTLEPCNHYGKTPPCSQALVAAKITRTLDVATQKKSLLAPRCFDYWTCWPLDSTKFLQGDLCFKKFNMHVHKRHFIVSQTVVIGVGDPNPLVGGAGITTLEKAGISVSQIGGALEQECYSLNPEFMKMMEAG